MNTEDQCNVSVLAAVFCEGVRVEGNGKEMLIGVYSGTINAPRIPGVVALQCWINLSIRHPSSTSLYFRITDHGNQQVHISEVHTETKEENSHGSIVLTPINYEVKDPESFLLVEYSEREGEWRPLIKKYVSYQSN